MNIKKNSIEVKPFNFWILKTVNIRHILNDRNQFDLIVLVILDYNDKKKKKLVKKKDEIQLKSAKLQEASINNRRNSPKNRR